MATVSDIIPTELQLEVDAALAWFNASQAESFDVTGIVDPELSVESPSPRELRLVLCGAGTCQKHDFLVASGPGGFEISSASAEDPTGGNPQSELDPPPGALRQWIDSVLPRHEFVLLLFYRGFW